MILMPIRWWRLTEMADARHVPLECPYGHHISVNADLFDGRCVFTCETRYGSGDAAKQRCGASIYVVLPVLIDGVPYRLDVEADHAELVRMQREGTSASKIIATLSRTACPSAQHRRRAA